jgi:hypothetical protein
MLSRKLAGMVALLMALGLGACNLVSQSAAAAEEALNPPTIEVSPTITLTALSFPTRTPIALVPTITVLDPNAQPTSAASQVALVPTMPPPEGVCSLKATGDYDVNVRRGPGTNFEIMSALPAGQYTVIIKQDVSGWYQIPWGREAVGWVSPKVVTLYGPCSSLRVNMEADLAAPSLTPTPTAVYNNEIGMNVFRVITLTAVGDIPAGTAVRVASAMYNGSTWMYTIATRDEHFGTATQSQLAYLPNGGGGEPTATVSNIATATVPVMSLPTDASPSDVVFPDGLCVVVAMTPTNLYAKPNSLRVVGILNPGPWAQVDAVSDQGWYKVTIWTDGSQGWTSLATVQLHGPCASLPVENVN